MAARRPATPAPITTKSVSAGRPFIAEEMVPPLGMTHSHQALRYDGNAMPQATIHVLPRPYQAWIENGLLNRAGSILSDLLPKASRIFVVTVPPVRKRWGAKFLRSLKYSGFDPQVIVMPDGEPSKRLANVEKM